MIAVKVTSESILPSGLKVQTIEKGRGRKYLLTDERGSTEVPSVTTVLDIQSKPALPWWGMKVGVAGVLSLIEDNILEIPDLGPVVSSTEDVVSMLTENKLTVNHVLTDAGERGTSVHDSFEEWCRLGALPATDGAYSAYLGGLRSLLEGLNPYATVDFAEVHVASLEHGFAGRLDAIITVADGCALMDKGQWVVDLKTSSGVYSSHHRQLAAYQYAADESGYCNPDGGYVFWVGKDGSWKVQRSHADFERDFLPALALWESEQALKKWVRPC